MIVRGEQAPAMAEIPTELFDQGAEQAMVGVGPVVHDDALSADFDEVA